jgi:hypothetical protein
MTMVGKQGGGRRVVAAAAASAATTARATVGTQTRVAVMVMEVGGVKGANEALTQTINDRTLLKICYLLLLLSSLSLAPSTASSTLLS